MKFGGRGGRCEGIETKKMVSHGRATYYHKIYFADILLAIFIH